MASPGHMMGPKKHKKHKSDRRERLDSSGDRPPGLKLILKVGNQATPEHTTDFGYGTHGNEEASCGGSGLQPMSTGVAAGGAIGGAPLLPPVVGHHDNDPYYGDTDVMMTSPGSAAVPPHHHRTHHKKSKKKKKKKDKSKDRDRDREGGGGKEQRKHRHHHKDKKRKREHATSDSGPGGDPVHAGGGATIGGNAVVAGATSAVNGGSPSQHREPRTCVLRKIQERTALQKMLDQLLGPLEKKDPQQFFAWPVTDNIAPGYSSIITQPMDFSTMRQKIEDNQYGNLQEFISDFKLMCSNAMKYNHTDTVYYKTAKKLLHFGTKIMQPEKLGWVLTLLPELTSEDVGFEITAELRQNKGGGVHADDHDDSDHHVQENKKRMPASKFEAIPDDLAPEEILAKAQIAAREAKAKLLLKRGGSSMGYLKQRKDGTTNLNILVGGDGVIPGTKKRPVLLGQLCGKLNEGTGQLQGFREDRRNIAKPVKPLYYGAFGSYAPSYDSAFSNLSKEESDLVYHTYGSDTAVQYAESVLDFVKDSDYATHLVDSLLDLLTGGDHSKTKRTLVGNKRLREEEEAIKTVLEVKPIDSVKVDVDELRSLQNLGIDVNFLDTMEDEIKQSEERNELQRRLDGTCQLLERLQRSQHRRLSSAPSPQMHVGLCPPPTDEEMRAAEQIVESLADLAKRAQPGDVAPLAGIRKAMGVAMPTVVTTPPPPPGLTSLSTNEVDSSGGGGGVLQNVVIPEAAVVADLESELRQFLESEPALNQSPLRADDKTIEEILME